LVSPIKDTKGSSMSIKLTAPQASSVSTQMAFVCNGATTWAEPLPPICRILTYRIHAAALGGPDKETLRLSLFVRTPRPTR
jgi:hypothetical protein